VRLQLPKLYCLHSLTLHAPQVAKEAASKFNPYVSLTAHHANIKDPQFNVEWFQSFNLVFNALDNLDARRHVNKMCLAADVPLIESGTMGFNGQVQVIKKGRTECYDCNPKEVPKSFPVCTIRSTPSQPIHCIVWAKSYLLPELFGVSEDETPELDTTTDKDNAEEIENLRREAQALKRIRESMGSDSFAKEVFEKVFKEDIERLRGMEDMWKTRKPPQPLEYDALQQEATTINTTISASDQQVWPLVGNFAVFSDSLSRLSRRLQDEQAAAMKNSSPKPIITFDKDDEDTLDFVTASANLRSAVFGIETKSKFDIKQMAGNIIPAIATTNAMTAGLCVLQAFKVMRGNYFSAKSAKMIYLERGGPRAMNSESLRPPNPDCAVCGIATSRLEVDPTRATLNDLVEDVLRLELGYGEELTINNEVGTVYDPDLDDNLGKKFEDLGIKDESFLTVIDDDEENPRVNVQFLISSKALPEDGKPVLLVTKPDIARRPRKPAAETNGETVIAIDPMANGTSTAKRKRVADDADLDGGTPIKKAQAAAFTDDAIVLDDKGDGAIVIDDD
jgi:ubiquitin-like 1-activating enzyme E1 B